MKFPYTTEEPTTQTGKQRTLHQPNVTEQVAVYDAFAFQDECALPAIRAVWRVIDQTNGEGDDENRRKRR